MSLATAYPIIMSVFKLNEKCATLDYDTYAC